MRLSSSLLLSAAALAVPLSPAPAQEAEVSGSVDPTENSDDPESANDIVVLGVIVYRNRSDAAEPVLTYDSEYFQRFEPLTAGDALKRVPSVTFLSDVLESDGARLRGLDPGYTQILINGEKVPGSNVDRSFFLDRIPAELLDRVEIVRSASARRSGDAMAGTLNIVLRDGYKLDGGYARVGGLRFDDGKLKPSLGAVWGGQVGPGRMLLGGNIQGRYNPKKKSSFRFGDSPENNTDYATDEFDNREDQDDTRNGTDYALNATYGIEGSNTDVEVGGFYVRTDRTESERSREYSDPTALTGPVGGTVGGDLLTDNSQFEDIDQHNYSLTGKAKHRWAAGETTLRTGYSRFVEDVVSTETEIDFDTDEDPPAYESERTLQDIRDREFSLGLEHSISVGGTTKVSFGAFYQDKDRDTDVSSAEAEDDLTEAFRSSYDPFGAGPGELNPQFEEFEAVTGGLNTIEEKRRDVFALVEGDSAAVKWEAGVRLETTRMAIVDLTVDPEFSESRSKSSLLLPSASAKISLTDSDRITVSGARTNRRPRFDYLSPALLEGELGDNDLLGNPDLKPETAWGVDVGYEHKIGRTGVAGVNLFYRKVSDLVEIANTGLEGSEGEGTFILQPQNSGNGKAWGIEFDLSTSLFMLGLPDTGIFGNLSLLDSEIEDFAGTRRFNGQPKYVYNLGFIQDIRSYGAAFGATYRKQGSARDRFVGEEVRTTYGADLELFVEKRFGKWLTVRGVGSNLLNSAKRETFNKFDTIEDQLDRDFDEYELESEKAGPVFQLIARAAF
ncbi:outer membrane beta-barrel protein [Sphingomonas sabuli]|uniref:Outer membrane beta-barrel protein n=1 Tax=Sphingomonas sabuli TaxID=2764186 RepID=A0A7G9L1D1_9SPHN|nr:outer membrane beta-barrel protein [Sphingomonas sabuli]QNM82430.1 outer membrane beta-barrel protein [Sphingomonas sabuli]